MSRLGSIEIIEILANHARSRPRGPALVDADGAVDFQTMERRSIQLANALASVGVRRGDRVALRFPNSRRHYEGLFACARLGAVLVPIDNSAPAADIAQIILDSDAGILLDSEDAYDDLISRPSPAHAQAAVSNEAPLLIMYTSGTSGTPKGVTLTHANIFFTSINQIRGWRLTANDRVLVVAPFHHISGLVLGFPCLHVGGTVHISPSTPDTLLETIERERITALFLPPSLWAQIAHTASIDRVDLRSVRLCASGGNPIPLPILKTLMQTFRAEFTGAYGLTEAASCSTILQGSDIIRHAGSVGKPLTHNRISVVDPDGRTVNAGDIGEIVQAGPTVMKGYWRSAAHTNVAIRDGKLWTGDLGFIDKSGFLHVVGRKNDIIIRNHIPIYPLEIELILREHPAINEAVVIGLDDARGRKLVVAIVEPRSGMLLEPADVMNYCAKLNGDEKVPQMVFIADSLPRTSSGKIDRTKLRATYTGLGLES
jgi:fatty-acyl-CoA synthase